MRHADYAFFPVTVTHSAEFETHDVDVLLFSYYATINAGCAALTNNLLTNALIVNVVYFTY